MDSWFFWKVLNPVLEVIAGAVGAALAVAVLGAVGFVVAALLGVTLPAVASVSPMTWVITLLVLILLKR
jgi:hypothetical protein